MHLPFLFYSLFSTCSQVFLHVPVSKHIHAMHANSSSPSEPAPFNTPAKDDSSLEARDSEAALRKTSVTPVPIAVGTDPSQNLCDIYSLNPERV